jgi:eukaryotic-like serine/threonine-protein kinase
MSPEQAYARRGTVDHRADVYALGATLYALLTLEPVVAGGSPQEVLYRTAHEEPRPLRQVDPTIPAELETIVLKALEKDPSRRYQTAQELAEDLRRFLADQPIQARRPTRRERAVKWLRRHPAAVRAALVAGVMTLLVIGGAAVLLFHERNEALRSERLARRAVDDIYTAFAENWLAHQPRLEPEERRVLLEALAVYQELSRRRPTDPTLRQETALAHRRVGDIQSRLGRDAEALAAYDAAVALLEQLAADSPDAGYRNDLAVSHIHRGNFLERHRQFPEAEAAYQRALELLGPVPVDETESPERANDRGGCLNNLGNVRAALGQSGDAEACYRQAVAAFTKLIADYPERLGYRHDLASGHNNLGHLLRNSGRTTEAEAAYKQALDLWQRLTREYPDRPVYRQGQGVALLNLAILFGAQKRNAEAEQANRRALAVRQRLVDDYPAVPVYRRDLAATYNGLGMLLALAGRPADAEPAYRQALALRHQLRAEDPARADYRDELAASYEGLGRLFQATGRPWEADEALQAARDARRGNE